jgi:hypothetical protein
VRNHRVQESQGLTPHACGHAHDFCRAEAKSIHQMRLHPIAGSVVGLRATRRS